MAKSKTWFAVTLLLAILTGLLVYRYLSSLNESPVEEMIAQVVARSRIAAGTKISKDMLGTVEVPVKYAHPSAVSVPESVTGRFALSDIYPGEVVHTGRVAAENTVTEVTYRTPEGLRAVTVPVNALSGVAGLLQPGHRVDVLVAFTEDDPVADAKVVTVVQNALVLAVGQDLLGSGEPQSVDNVTLALTPAEVQLVALGEFIGNLKLSARPAGDTGKPDLSHMTVERMLQLYP